MQFGARKDVDTCLYYHRLGTPTVFSSVVPAFFDDDLDFGGRRGFPSPRSVLRDAEKTFRQLDRLVNSAGNDLVVSLNTRCRASPIEKLVSTHNRPCLCLRYRNFWHKQEKMYF
jgi:hypothetical protein